MGLFDFLFGTRKKRITDFKNRGAIVLDVRSKTEYGSGAIPGSENIPLHHLNSKISEIKKWNKPVICCCASGMRSASAASMLHGQGVEAMNGGGWSSLLNKLQ